MTLVKPENVLLMEMYEAQEKRFQAIVEEIVELEEYLEVRFLSLILVSLGIIVLVNGF
jgi:hypothetical protein